MAPHRPTSRYQRVRASATQFIHHPQVELVILVLVAASVGLVTASFLLPRRHGWMPAILAVSDALTGLFVVELTVRYWVANNKRRFFRRYWVDILAVLPMVRPLRFFRVLRVLRLQRMGVLLSRRPGAVSGSFRESAGLLTSLATASLTLVVLAAAGLNAFESRASELGRFDRALWFSVFSLVAGEPLYGQPDSTGGRLIALAVMVGGMSLFGVFVGMVSAAMVGRMAKGVDMAELDLDELRGHVVVCGWNRAGIQLFRELSTIETIGHQGLVLITEGPEPDDLPRDVIDPRHFHHLQGDYTRPDVLERAGVPHASKAILLTDRQVPRSDQDRDARTVLAALTIERMAEHIYTVAEVVTNDVEDLLQMAGVEEVVNGDWYAGAVLGSAVRTEGIVQVFDELLSGDVGNNVHAIPLPASWAGQTAGVLHTHLYETHGVTLLALDRRGQRTVNPTSTLPLEAGDRVVVVGQAVPKLGAP